ncbi:MAG: hypothetical protein WBB30_08950 [Solirubrobacterales bacterium]
MRRRRRTALLAAAAAVALVAAGCGAEEFPNDPRPPAPVQLSAAVNTKKVLIATTLPNGTPVGAGLANFTISNQTSDPVALTFSGVTDDTTDPIVAEGELNFQLDLVEGPYTVRADDPAINAADFVVGPERPSAQNDLLLP